MISNSLRALMLVEQWAWCCATVPVMAHWAKAWVDCAVDLVGFYATREEATTDLHGCGFGASDISQGVVALQDAPSAAWAGPRMSAGGGGEGLSSYPSLPLGRLHTHPSHIRILLKPFIRFLPA